MLVYQRVDLQVACLIPFCGTRLVSPTKVYEFDAESGSKPMILETRKAWLFEGTWRTKGNPRTKWRF